jgi:hypothetical protein
LADTDKTIDFGWGVYVFLFMIPAILLLLSWILAWRGIISFEFGIVPLPVIGMLFGMMMNCIGIGSLCEGEIVIFCGDAISFISFVVLIIGSV